MKRTISTLMMASAAFAVGVALMPLDASAKKPSPELNVDCDAGQSLQAALDDTKLREPIKIYVKGACTDGPYRITQDVHLIGSPTAHLAVPSSSDWLWNVVGVANGSYAQLVNLTVDASSREVGIGVYDNSTAYIDTVTISDASGPAINVADGSSAWVTGVDLSDSGVGLQVTQSASAALMNSSVHDNRIGVNTMVFSTLALDGNTIVNNTAIGIDASSGGMYGSVNTRGTPNTIEFNEVDVYCNAGGLFNADQSQNSSTKTTVIDPDCRVFGTIFD